MRCGQLLLTSPPAWSRLNSSFASQALVDKYSKACSYPSAAAQHGLEYYREAQQLDLPLSAAAVAANCVQHVQAVADKCPVTDELGPMLHAMAGRLRELRSAVDKASSFLYDSGYRLECSSCKQSHGAGAKLQRLREVVETVMAML